MSRRQRGFVLVGVLFVLVLLSALAGGACFEALQEMRLGRNAEQAVTLQATAESGLTAALAAWDPRTNGTLAVGSVLRLPGAAPQGIAGSVDARRLSDRLLLLRSSATLADGSSRTVARIARLVGPEAAPAAVRARWVDPIVSARADGTDQNPPLWSCPPTSGSAPGTLLQPGASDSAFFRFGPMDWPALAAWAGAVPAGGDSLAVRYSAGDLTLSGGRVLGTLVVAGDLVLRSGVEVVGLVLVRGTLRLEAGGATVLGVVVASQVIVDQSVTPQQLTLGYSSCSATRAALSRATPAPLRGVPLWGVF